MISFDQSTHTYSIDGDETFTSVTTLMSSWFKPFNVDNSLRSMLKANRERKYPGMTDDQIKKHWVENGDMAMALGTALHLHIEMALTNQPVEDDSLEYKYFESFRADHVLTPFQVEWRLCYPPNKLVGTVDYANQNEDGSLDLYDWKRSNKVNQFVTYRYSTCLHPELRHVPDTSYWRYTLQLNLYRFLAEKNGHRIRHMYIVGFHPLNASYEKLQVQEIDMEKVLNTTLV